MTTEISTGRISCLAAKMEEVISDEYIVEKIIAAASGRK